MQRPKVSVALITYNHASFIRDAVQGILDQRGDFDMEVVLGDDRSPDGTAQLVRQLIGDRLPLRVIERTANVGMNRNWLETIAACDGDFVALLEGDDCWTDATKTERQIRALTHDPHAAICFSDATVANETGDGRTYRTYLEEADMTEDQMRFEVEDLIRLNFMPTATVMYRRQQGISMGPAYFKSPYVDWIFHMTNACKGHVVRVGGTTALYRLHGSGAFGGTDSARRRMASVRCLAAMHSCLRHASMAPQLFDRYLAAIDRYAYDLPVDAHASRWRARQVRRLSSLSGSTWWATFL